MTLIGQFLRLLLIEDSDPDAEFIQAELTHYGFKLSCQRVQTEPDFRSLLAASPWDVIIADYRLPRFGAVNALNIVQETGFDIPFIIVSGAIGEDVAVAAMKAGANDYVMKGKLARLGPAVERELRDAEVRRARARAESDSRFQAHLLNAVAQAVVATDEAGKITYWNRPAEDLFGWSAKEALGKLFSKMVTAVKNSGDEKHGNPVELFQSRSWFGEITLRRRDQVPLTILVANSPVHDAAGKAVGMIQVATDVTQRKQAELELADSRAQLRALAAKLERVREEERKGLSRDIHDELGQVLTGLKMELAWMRSRINSPGAILRKALLEKIHQLGTQIDSSANSIRKLCAELRPGILDDLGLVAAIEWQAGEFKKRTGIECQICLPTDDPPLGPDENTAVFRIFQEVLTNVARHAKASRVTVKLSHDQQVFRLEASDNGRGIRSEDLSGARSLGLLGMRERAMALGGSIEFQGHPGGGTQVRLFVPLQTARLSPNNSNRLNDT